MKEIRPGESATLSTVQTADCSSLRLARAKRQRAVSNIEAEKGARIEKGQSSHSVEAPQLLRFSPYYTQKKCTHILSLSLSLSLSVSTLKKSVVVVGLKKRLPAIPLPRSHKRAALAKKICG